MSGLLSAFLLTGFSGREKYVELESLVNGRSSADFSGRSQNVRNVLSKGTRGEILESKKLASGNFGLRIKVLNGPNTNQVYWVYHKVNDSDLALYETTNWNHSSPRKTASVAEATGVETLRDTQAKADVKRDTIPAASQEEAQDAIDLIAHSTEKLKQTAQGSCRDCETTAAARELPLLRAPKKAMSKACTDFMNNEGELGQQGQAVLSIMAEPDYARHFTASNSLGAFCPKFNTLTQSQKLTAWTWFWTSLAMEESSCIATKEHATTYTDRQGNIRVLNPREGYGFWALERDRNVRHWRGEACRDIGTPDKQARCAIDIMMKTQLSRGRTAGINSSSYWGPVRRGQTQIIPHMRRLTLCF